MQKVQTKSAALTNLTPEKVALAVSDRKSSVGISLPSLPCESVGV